MTLDRLRIILQISEELIEATEVYKSCRMSDLAYLSTVKTLAAQLKTAREAEEKSSTQEVRM